MPLTPQQETAVYDRGGSLLVSAAAGSGKTKVLVERLFSYMEQEGCQVDDFLIITYTKAAAAELRGKIAQELTRRVADRPGDSHLRRQMLRVYQADIKTVDAFCAGLLRENVHLLPPVEEHSLTPDFRVLDEQEAMLLRRRVLDRVLEDFYAHIEEDGNARQLAETLGAGRDDRALEALVLDLHEKTQSHPHPLRWLEQLRQGWEVTPQELADNGCGRYLMEDALRRADFWARRLTRAVEDMADYPAVYKAYGDRFLEVAQGLEALRDQAAGGWDSLAQGVPSFRRMGVAKGEENAACRERAKAVLEQAKKALKDIQAIFSVPEAELLEDLRQMAPAMLALLRLTAQFTLHYQAEKVRRNVMDFSDQEHYAIDLLTDGQGRPTELAKQVSSRYREVMVDEYQDSNQVQNCIFRALSGEERRLFAVGDVKQSIYRFRLADPTIFLEKYLSYRPAAEAEEGQPRKVLLSRNFRSRREVLDGTNFVFRAIMSREMGEMDYGDDEQLYFGAEAAYPPRPGMEPELHLISVENTEEETFDRTEVEARFVARRIRRLLDQGFPVQGEDGQPRPVEPEDIVILMRSPRARLAAYTAALRRENIPCTSGESEAFFSTLEAAVMVSFLQIIDNPRQDVPLIAVLRSPLFGFSPDRLAQIRALLPEGDYYDALCLDEHEDTAAFRQTLDGLRLAARDMTADRLLWKLYTQCHAMAVFGAMEGGAARKENLIALYTYAGQQAAAGRGGLFDFVTQLHDLLEEGRQPPISTQATGSGVQIMETLLSIIANVNNTVGKLANRLREAWEANKNGVAIWNVILDVVQDILDFFNEISAATLNWAQELNLEPIVTAFRSLLEVFEPLVDVLLGGLSWAWENILLPLAKWTIEEATPAAINLLASVFKALTPILQSVFDLFNAIWEIIKPIAEFFGSVLISAIQSLGSAIEWLGDTLSSIIDLISEAANALSDFLGRAFSGFGTAVLETFTGGGARTYAAAPHSLMDAYPHLASGAVISPNNEFLAVLGDQRSGMNIETPAATMLQMFKQALAESDFGGDVTVNFKGNATMAQFVRTIYPQIEVERQRRGPAIGGSAL